MPKNRRRNNAEVTKRPRIPNRADEEYLAVVTEIFGGEHMGVRSENGVDYLGVIRGKIKKRMWVRLGDVVLITPWADMTVKKDKKPKAHIIWRYTRTQVNWLQNHGYVKPEFLEELQNI
ncbi:MAG: translation initiation factor 1A [Candidatus Lokiarchaeota archaeon]|nr:translation initiation factor 1A [Candidatus Harpocratesius repetitus]